VELRDKVKNIIWNSRELAKSLEAEEALAIILRLMEVLERQVK
jgi:hypothetical protein